MAKTIPASGRTATIPPVTEKPIVSEEYARHPRKRKLDWRQIGLAALLIGPNLLGPDPRKVDTSGVSYACLLYTSDAADE